MIKRSLQIEKLPRDLNILLLGPRQTGKTTLLKSSLKNAFFINLLESDTYLNLSKNPSHLRGIVGESNSKTIVIDEIQKVPELLDEVHLMMEADKKLHFILTGSSARKLKKKGVNLLGGRVFPLYFHPLTSSEIIDENIPFSDYFLRGGIPSILQSKHHRLNMQSYLHLYLKEEILEEGLVRNIGPFSRFLDVAATMNTEQIDFSAIASDAQIASKTVSGYFDILQDTLVGYLLPSFRETKSRKAVATPKFYFFDLGITNYLLGREAIKEKTPEFGKVLEHFIFLELRAYIDYNLLDAEIYYWRSQSQIEIDFIVKLRNKKLIAVEVKGSENVRDKHAKPFTLFEEDLKLERKIIVSNEKMARTTGDNVSVLPYLTFCKQLWAGKIF